MKGWQKIKSDEPKFSLKNWPSVLANGRTDSLRVYVEATRSLTITTSVTNHKKGIGYRTVTDRCAIYKLEVRSQWHV